ncbi:mdm2-binding protein [Bufo gargarizans]|uniref:mdm2-binding protein n=1 Tax=Bufo gargarizans TaxID=30331 RepID=UPI001CF37882|nr:mdm2-binding protein [Bufo gargarizans]
MERYVLLIYWQRQTERYRESPQQEPPLPSGLADVKDFYTHLKEQCTLHTDAFPACSLAGEPGTRKCFFAIQATNGITQYSSPDWEDLCPCSVSDSEEQPSSTIDDCICALQSPEDDEDDCSSRDSVSQASLFQESAELIHQLSDKLPAPGRVLVDVLLISQTVPKLKECVLAVGAIKHLKEWHAAKITIVTRERRGWQKISNYLSANVIAPDGLTSALDPQEFWRGSVEISEQKFTSEVEFQDFCIRSCCDVGSQSRFLKLNDVCKNQHDGNQKSLLPEVFHYYGSSLEFIQMVSLSELPPYFISSCVYELCLTRNSLQGKSKLMLGQLCSMNDKVGAIFMLSCNVCSHPLPPALQRSSKKWKDYMSRKPKEIQAPGVELKGEYCSYYFLIQGKDNGVCKATMLHSAGQINGAASLVLLHRRLRDKPNTDGSNFSALKTLPHYHGDHLMKREKCLAEAQALVVKEYLQRQEAGQPVNSLKALLKLTRESVLRTFESKLRNTDFNQDLKSSLYRAPPSGSDASSLFNMKSSEWPERNVLQNLENFEKIKQRIRASILSSSADHLLGRKDIQKEGITLLDAKELLKYFTPQGAAVGELQPLQVQRGENAFLLTPELTPRKLRALPFDKASACYYHGLEYCLDNRKALDRDVAFSELQSRLIRYETQTTCTRECCPIPFALSPLPSPAVLSEPGSVPDGESLQGADPLRLKRRSRDLDGLIASKRLAKSESSDSLLSIASESSGPNASTKGSRPRSQRVAPMSSSVRPTSRDRGTSLSSNSTQTQQSTNANNEVKESRSEKHNRMLREVVCKTLLKHGIQEGHLCYAACLQRLFDISKFFLKDLKTSRGLQDEMKKAASNNVKQVIQWELDKLKKK